MFARVICVGVIGLCACVRVFFAPLFKRSGAGRKRPEKCKIYALMKVELGNIAMQSWISSLLLRYKERIKFY